MMTQLVSSEPTDLSVVNIRCIFDRQLRVRIGNQINLRNFIFFLSLFLRYTNLVCLPETIPEVAVGTKCWITGWGALQSGGSQPETLQQASVPIVHQDTCKTSYPNQIDDTMICAGLKQGGIDACQGMTIEL